MNGDAYVIRDVDYATLPDALLPTAKQHMRVEFARDDDYIKLCLKRAIEYFQLYSGQLVFAAKVDWSPLATRAGFVTCPVLPVSDQTAKDAEGTDVTADYKVVQIGSSTVYPLFATISGSALPGGLAVILIVGFDDVAKMPPEILDKILRIAATLYENRETVTTPIQTMPFWLNDLLIGSWVPRV
jgi:uncharacterized phiE125 gp8 family phage protein